MKISYNWLKQFLDIDLEVEKVSEILTGLGLEVEGVELVESVKGSLKGIIVGQVLTCIKHPNADRLKVTTVDLNNGEPVQIVCGAPNVAVGQKVPVATVGTSLYDADGKEFKIKKGNIRGQESHGMICAEDELGLGSDHDGIMVLDKSTQVGRPAAEIFKISTDHVFEIGLTPNRADAMSHLGVARDLRAALLRQGKTLELKTPSLSNFHVDERSLRIDIEVEDNNLVPRYVGVTIDEITVKDSPKWLQERLKAIGLAPINNIVDITNFVLHELGQPLHAFDAAKIQGHKILVKNLASGTKFITLDGVERNLDQEDIMICDANSEPLCIAGVYGGLNSGVSSKTKTIFLESAYFDPISIRKTAKRFGLNTDASFRFERGIDPNICEIALKRAALLIEELAGAKITSDIIDIYPKKIQDKEVHFSFENAFRLIGEEISKDIIKSILVSLDISIINQTETALGLRIPAYRVDVTREADIVEEILRVYGYNNIATPSKLNSSVSYSDKLNTGKLQDLISDQLVSQGFYEMMANSLTSPHYLELSSSYDPAYNVEILNPLSTDLAVLRQSMLFSSLEAMAYNINRKNSNVKFFEFGHTYHHYPNSYEEEKHLGLTITGNRTADSWRPDASPSDFFYLKGIVNAVLMRLGINSYQTKALKKDIYSEGLALYLGKQLLVEFGPVAQKVLKGFGIKQEVLYADFNWKNIVQLRGSKNLKVKDLAKYPSVKRDLALLLDQEVSFNELYKIAFQTEKKLLSSVDLFDVYQGKNLPDNKKSYALSFVLQDQDKTLNEDEIDRIMQKLQKAFETKLNATLRA